MRSKLTEVHERERSTIRASAFMVLHSTAVETSGPKDPEGMRAPDSL